jgi:hypothetical protein
MAEVDVFQGVPIYADTTLEVRGWTSQWESPACGPRADGMALASTREPRAVISDHRENRASAGSTYR